VNPAAADSPTAATQHDRRRDRTKAPEPPGRPPRTRPSTGTDTAAGWIAIVLAAVIAASPLATGYFAFSAWGILALAALAMLVMVILIASARLSRPGIVAAAGLALLVALSGASIIWAESKESAWTATNRLVLYCAIFAIAMLAVRRRWSARSVAVLLGIPALATSVLVIIAMLAGSAGGDFLVGRLNAPIGYINGTAGLLGMGLWPWLAGAESWRDPRAQAASLAACVLIGGVAVLTQSRALIPALVLGGAVVLTASPGRTRRAVNLLILAMAVAGGLHWTLAVYTSSGSGGASVAPTPGALRAAAIAVLAGAAAAGFAAFAITSATATLSPSQRARLRTGVGSALALCTVIMVVAAGVFGGGWIARQYHYFIGSHAAPENASVRFLDASGFRSDLWRVAIREFASEPLGGLGAGNYDDQYYRLRHNPEYVAQPHSLELQMAAELGVGGLLGLALLLGGILWAACGRTRTMASSDRLLKVSAAGVFVAWFACTSVDWLYDIPGLTGMAMLAGALLVVPEARSARATGRAGRPHAGIRRPMVLSALVVIALGAASLGRQYVASRLASSGAGETIRSPAAAISTLRQSLALDPFSLPVRYSLAAAYAAEDDYAQTRDIVLAAAAREPENYVPPALLGDIALRRGQRALAVSEYRRALALDPRDPMLRRALARAQSVR
jgi:hypothetical protein